jgi:transcription termination factor NusB
MQTNINIIWNIISTILEENFSFAEIKKIVALSGLDRTILMNLEQKQGFGGASKAQLINEIDKNLEKFSQNNKQHFFNLLIEEILKRKNDLKDQLEEYLKRLGWQLYNNTIIPVKILDLSELQELDNVSHKDLIKAAQRFRDGDLSGALGSACSSVESVTYKIYNQYSLGDPDKASFQEKCNKTIEKIGILEDINTLSDIGWSKKDIKPLRENLKGSLNQMAFVMQKLRAKMSDVHGTKEVLKPLVLDSLKYAQILIRMMTKNI